MKRIILILLSFLFVGLTGCYKDKGNYDYSDIYVNKITITFPLNSISVSVGEPVIFTPIVTYTNEEQVDTNIYRWEYCFDYLDLVCTERDMNMVIENAIVGQKYTGLVIATDTTTGAKYTAAANLDFTYKSPYTVGWLLLANEGNKSKLHMLREVNKEWSKVEDVYYVINKEELGSSPKKIVFTSIGRNEVRIFQDGPGGGVVLLGTTYQPIETFDKEFISGSLPAGFKPVDFLTKGKIGIMIGENGEMYTKIFNDNATYPFERFAIFPTTYGVNKLNVQHLTHEQNTLYNPFFYDLTTRSFYMIYGANYTGAGQVIQAAPPVGWVSSSGEPAPNNLEDFDVIVCESVTGKSYDQDIASLLRHRTTNKLFIYTFFASTSGGVVKVSNIRFEPFSVPDEIEIFHFLRTRPYVLWTNGSKLYWYDKRTKENRMFKDYGSKILALESDYSKDNSICVALDNGAVYIQDIQESTFVSGADIVIYTTTLPGKVVDLFYKNK